MGLFDAVALGLVFFQKEGFAKNDGGVRRPLS
jgi:hypothetical protein